MPKSVIGATYIVERGDTLSEIAQKKLSGRVYGKNGSLNLLLSQNPDIQNPDFIVPDQVIQLPDKFAKVERRKPAATLRKKIRAHRTVAQQEATPSVEPQKKEKPPDEKSDPTLPKKSTLREDGPSGFDWRTRVGSGYTILGATEVSNGTKATLSSSLGWSFNAELGFRWKEHYRSYVEITSHYIPINQALTRTIVNANQFYSSVGLGLQRYWDGGHHVGLKFLYQEQIHYWAPSATQLRMERVGVGKAEGEVEADIFNLGPLEFFLGTNVWFLFSGSHEQFSTNPGYGGELFLRVRGGGAFQPELKISYGYQLQNSSLINVNRTDFGLSLSISGDFL